MYILFDDLEYTSSLVKVPTTVGHTRSSPCEKGHDYLWEKNDRLEAFPRRSRAVVKIFRHIEAKIETAFREPPTWDKALDGRSGFYV
jgi:hypothetical protein